MSRYQFEVATPADDADLRHVLAETPMEGQIAVSFRREPSYFAAAAVEGNFRQAVAARDSRTGRVVGFGARSIGPRYVNGQQREIGYLSSLRLLAEHRRGTLIARGYAFFHQLHQDARTQLYLTTVAAGNHAALATLTPGRAGLPRYYPHGDYHTLAIPLTKRPETSCCAKIDLRFARQTDRAEILAFLAEQGPRRQFFPCYAANDLFSADGLLRALQPEDVLLAFCSGRLVGMLGAWDQHHFRQTVVNRYGRALRFTRPLYNGWASLQGRPRLPAPRQPFRYLSAALPVVAADDANLFRQLLVSQVNHRAGGQTSHLLVGLHGDDPLLPVARELSVACYTTTLFVVCWPDGEPLRASLDARPPYLELGCL